MSRAAWGRDHAHLLRRRRLAAPGALAPDGSPSDKVSATLMAISSNTARSGYVYPVMMSAARAFGSEPDRPRNHRRPGRLLAAVVPGLLGVVAVPLVSVAWSVYSELHTKDAPVVGELPRYNAAEKGEKA